MRGDLFASPCLSKSRRREFHFEGVMAGGKLENVPDSSGTPRV